MWKANSKHEKLSEELALQNSKEADQELANTTLANENDVVTFKLKYIGSLVVDKITGENVSSEAVKNIIKTAKALKRKRLQTVNLNISIQGISITDVQGNDILKISIYRISNCSTDAAHRQIFSFISTDSNEIPECHAFLCSKRKVAQTVTLAVANAFSTAYQVWRKLPHSNDDVKLLQSAKENQKNNLNHISTSNYPISNNILESSDAVKEERLIDFDSEPLTEEIFFMDNWTASSYPKKEWVSFEDDFHSDSFNS